MVSLARKLTFTIAFLSLAIGAFAQLTPRTMPNQMGYLEYLPQGYAQSKTQYPVIIHLHGMGERGNGTTEIWNVAKIGPAKEIKNGSNMTFEVNGQKHSFVVIVPQLTTDKNEWKSETIDTVVEFVKQKYRIDESRIYLTGLSLGGGGAWNYASEYGYKIAALAPVCGAAWPNTTRANNIAMHNVPVWAFHGLKDTTVPPASSRNWVSLINSRITSVPAQLTEYEDVGHAAWTRAYATDHTYHEVNLYEWLLSHSRKSSSDVATVQQSTSTAKTLHVTNDILPDLE